MLKHTFQSAKSDGADAALIRPSNWNREHTWDGGAHQNLLMRDTGATDGASWQTLLAILAQLVTTRGDLVTRDATQVIRRALGLTKQYLKSDGTDNLWDYVKSVQESGGPTVLDVGAIPDGQFVKRTGATLVGVAASAVSKFTLEFISAEQALALTSQITVAHGLGVLPKLTQLVLRCTTAELGYSVGDEYVFPGVVVPGAVYQAGVVSDATNCVILTGESFRLPHKATSTSTTLTLGNWRLVVRAWA